jgi:hypothetical protein
MRIIWGRENETKLKVRSCNYISSKDSRRRSGYRPCDRCNFHFYLHHAITSLYITLATSFNSHSWLTINKSPTFQVKTIALPVLQAQVGLPHPWVLQRFRFAKVDWQLVQFWLLGHVNPGHFVRYCCWYKLMRRDWHLHVVTTHSKWSTASNFRYWPLVLRKGIHYTLNEFLIL